MFLPQPTRQPPPPPSLALGVTLYARCCTLPSLQAGGLLEHQDPTSLPATCQSQALWSLSLCRQTTDFHPVPESQLPGLGLRTGHLFPSSPLLRSLARPSWVWLSGWQHPVSPAPPSPPLAYCTFWLRSIQQHTCIPYHITGTFLDRGDPNGTRQSPPCQGERERPED